MVLGPHHHRVPTQHHQQLRGTTAERRIQRLERPHLPSGKQCSLARWFLFHIFAVVYVMNDPYALQAQVKKAYLLHQKGLLTDKEFADAVGESVLKTTNLPDPNPPEREPCKGFQWIGQSFEHCDGCGEPYWEHTHDQQFNRDKGPFDEDCWLYMPITDESKAKVKARYASNP